MHGLLVYSEAITLFKIKFKAILLLKCSVSKSWTLLKQLGSNLTEFYPFYYIYIIIIIIFIILLLLQVSSPVPSTVIVFLRVSGDSAVQSTLFRRFRRTVLRPPVHRRTVLRRSVGSPSASGALSDGAQSCKVYTVYKRYIHRSVGSHRVTLTCTLHKLKCLILYLVIQRPETETKRKPTVDIKQTEQNLLVHIFICQRQLYLPSKEKSEIKMNWHTVAFSSCANNDIRCRLQLQYVRKAVLVPSISKFVQLTVIWVAVQFSCSTTVSFLLPAVFKWDSCVVRNGSHYRQIHLLPRIMQAAGCCTPNEESRITKSVDFWAHVS